MDAIKLNKPHCETIKRRVKFLDFDEAKILTAVNFFKKSSLITHRSYIRFKSYKAFTHIIGV